MVKYTPPPDDLTKLNPIQRYLQKGSLEREDYIRLFAVVVVYWFLRPYIQKLLKRLSGPEFQEGEDAQVAYKLRREQAKVDPNNIRGKKEKADTRTLGDLLDEGATASGSKAEEDENKGAVKNRKKGVSFAPEKSEEDKLLDWDDEPSRYSEEGDKGDVMEWINKWD